MTMSADATGTTSSNRANKRQEEKARNKTIKGNFCNALLNTFPTILCRKVLFGKLDIGRRFV